MVACVIGIDGGGTKARAAVVGMDGAYLSEGIAGPCSLSALSATEALASAHAASLDGLGRAGLDIADVRAICVGVAGWSQWERRRVFEQQLRELFPAARTLVAPDYGVALTGATEGKPGVIVVAGTGSVAFGENAAGETHRTGAYGYLIDDAGSGYGVGRSILKAVMRAQDGTGQATTLADRLYASSPVQSIEEIVTAVYGGVLDRPSIAALAPLASAAADEDQDPVARAILRRAGGALARLTEGVTGRLFRDPHQPVPVALVGSLWNSGPWLSDVFDRSLARFAPSAISGPPRLPPEQGAALRALEACRSAS